MFWYAQFSILATVHRVDFVLKLCGTPSNRVFSLSFSSRAGKDQTPRCIAIQCKEKTNRNSVREPSTLDYALQTNDVDTCSIQCYVNRRRQQQVHLCVIWNECVQMCTVSANFYDQNSIGRYSNSIIITDSIAIQKINNSTWCLLEIRRKKLFFFLQRALQVFVW